MQKRSKHPLLKAFLLISTVLIVIVSAAQIINMKDSKVEEVNNKIKISNDLETEESEKLDPLIISENENKTLDSKEEEIKYQETMKNIDKIKEKDEKAPLLSFAGDIYFSSFVLESYKKSGINGVLSKEYRDLINSSDMFIANEEFPFTKRGEKAPDKQFTFRVNPSDVKVMNELNIDLLSLANNHALDFGNEGLLDSIETLDNAGIGHIGGGKNIEEASKPFIKEINGQKICFIGASRVIPVASWTAGANHPGMLTAYDDTALLKLIEEYRKQSDYIIVYIHWGIERSELPNDIQKNLGKRIIDAGADMVLGAHPHVPQGIEYYKGKPIVYSLGNFIFGSKIPKTFLLNAELSKENIKLSIVPGKSSNGYTREMDESEKEDFYRYMEGISKGIKIDNNGNIICNTQ